VIFTGIGSTSVNGGAGGYDTIVGGSGALSVTAQNGDAIFGNSGALNVTGSLKGADSVVGGSGALNLAGRGANLLVVGGTGSSNVNVGDGASLVFAGSGNVSLIGGSGSMQVVGGSGTATIIEGSGATTLQVVKGQAGGMETISGFRPGADTVELFGYQPAQQSVSAAQGSTTISLVDGTKITLLGVTDPQHSVIG
jgi:Ca2+-binding RTX toxin-like protein